MSLTDFLHGVETITVDAGPRPIKTIRSSVIGLIYTAPDADVVKFPLNVPVLFNRRSDMAKLGTTGTGPMALDSIFDQVGALVVGIRVADSVTENIQLGNVIGGVDPSTGALTGVHAFRAAESMFGVPPMLLCAPGFTHQRPVGVVNTTITAQGTGYTAATVAFSGGGATVQATGHCVIAAGKVTGIVLDSPGYGYASAPTVTITGNGSGATATAATGASSNPVVGEMLGVANGLRAHIIADGPSTTDSDALAYRDDWGSRRIYIVDPKVDAWSASDFSGVYQPASARVAGHIAHVDDQYGFWESPSNKEITGVGGLSRPIDYAYGDKNSRANILNENAIATFIRDDGWYLWGNRNASADQKYAFLSVSRTMDMVDISIARAHRWAVDRGITKGYFDDVTQSVRAYLRSLWKRGAIIGPGDCWVDPEKNTNDQITQGHVTFSYDFTPIYPAERVTFESSLTDKYLTYLFK